MSRTLEQRPGAVLADIVSSAITACKDGADLSQRRAEFRKPA